MPEQSLYRPTLSKAWQITKKFKSLWVVGLFATLLSSGGEYEIITRFFYNPENKGFISEIIESFNTGIQAGLATGGNLWENLWLAVTSSPLTTIIGILILLLSILVAIFFIWLAITSQVALVKNIDAVSKNKKSSINDGIAHGVKVFWPIFWSQVILKTALFVFFLIFGFLASFFTTGFWEMVAYFVIFIIFVVLAILISMIPKFQMLYITLNKYRFVPALKSGWDLFLKNWLICLEMALVLLLIYIAGLFVSAFASVILTAGPLVAIPLYFPTIAPIAANIILGLCIVGMVAIIILVAATVTTFQWAAWTILFNRLTSGEEESKIMRTIGQLQSLPNITSK